MIIVLQRMFVRIVTSVIMIVITVIIIIIIIIIIIVMINSELIYDYFNSHCQFHSYYLLK